jgi:hypothetical protein
MAGERASPRSGCQIILHQVVHSSCVETICYAITRRTNEVLKPENPEHLFLTNASLYIDINNRELKQCEDVKYLGMHHDRRMT